MKKILALTVIFLGLTGFTQMASAGPERISSKDKEVMAAPAPPPCNWTGFYLGVQGGYGWGDLRWTTSEFIPEELIVQQTHSGFFVGGEEGYNYQIGWLVLGVEGDFSYSDVNARTGGPASLQIENPGPSTFETGTDWVGSVGLRVGVAFHRFLFFAKGGVSFANLNYSWFRVDTAPAEEPHTESFETTEMRTAPMVGGGVEYALSCHWSAKIEYKHLFLGRNHIRGVSVDTFGEAPESGELEIFKSEADQNQVQLGLNYKL